MDSSIVSNDPSADRAYVNYATQDGKYIIGIGNTSGLLRIYDVENNLWFPETDIKVPLDYRSIYADFSVETYYKLSKINTSTSGNKGYVLMQFNPIKHFLEEFLFIISSDNSSMKCALVPIEGKLNESYKIGISNAYFFQHGVPQEVEMFYGDGDKFNPINERVVLNG